MLIPSSNGTIVVSDQLRYTIEDFKNKLRRQLFKVRWAQAHGRIDPDDARILEKSLIKKIASL